jgi:hypothetical protein
MAQDQSKPPTGPADDQRAIRGVLEAYWEQGMEGTIAWSLQDERYISPNGQCGLKGLHVLKNGDYLKVFNDAACKEMLWEGEIRLKAATNLQKGVDPAIWRKMFADAKPGILIEKALKHERCCGVRKIWRAIWSINQRRGGAG